MVYVIQTDWNLADAEKETKWVAMEGLCEECPTGEVTSLRKTLPPFASSTLCRVRDADEKLEVFRCY